VFVYPLLAGVVAGVGSLRASGKSLRPGESAEF
jgi:hypothetical protein